MNPSPEIELTYALLERIFQSAKSKFDIRLLGDGLSEAAGRPQVFIRHDVDVSIKRALSMAELEAASAIRATYMFIPNSRLYDIRAEGEDLRRIDSLGHEVALHFDLDDAARERSADVQEVLDDIERDCCLIADITGKPVRSISFHRPMPQLIGGEFVIGGRINAYASELMDCYISDSRGQWRCGDPVRVLSETSAPIVQLLIHPVWYGPDHMNPRKRLEEFFLSVTGDSDPAARRQFDADLAFTVPGVRRANYEAA